VRAYAAREIDDRLISDLLEAAMAAPSACCKDPWHFVVVKDRALLRGLAEGLPNGRMLAGAGAGVVVCGVPAEAHDSQVSYMLQDCSAAVENLLLAAAMLGLGACWLGGHPREERIRHVRKVLGIPDSVVPVAAVAVGWPAENPEPRTRYSGSRVHREGWSEA
jgi:nitroreductase